MGDKQILMQYVVDGTLSILCNAAQSRGLSHKITRNMALLAGTHLDIHHDIGIVYTSWNPSRERDSQEYQIPTPGSKRYLRQIERQKWRPVVEEALDTFGEVIRMAEGNDNVSLGRVRPRQLHRLT